VTQVDGYGNAVPSAMGYFLSGRLYEVAWPRHHSPTTAASNCSPIGSSRWCRRTCTT